VYKNIFKNLKGLWWRGWTEEAYGPHYGDLYFPRYRDVPSVPRGIPFTFIRVGSFCGLWTKGSTSTKLLGCNEGVPSQWECATWRSSFGWYRGIRRSGVWSPPTCHRTLLTPHCKGTPLMVLYAVWWLRVASPFAWVPPTLLG